MRKNIFELELPDLDNPTLASSESLVDSQPKVDARTAKKLTPTEEKLSDPIFKLLADPVLPRLKSRDRAKLQLQSPNRIHLYWSMKSNPYQILKDSVGAHPDSYSLVARVLNLTNGEEKLFRVEPKGDWWLDVRPNNKYRAEIGFYAPNRPFIRILFSNELTTPRKSPSPRTDYTTGFSTTAREFAETLDAAGYRKDAFDVAIAGDQPDQVRSATERAAAELFEVPHVEFSDSIASELRFALLAMASGYSIEDLVGHVSLEVIEMLQSHLSSADRNTILSVMESNFDLVTEEIEEFEEIGEAVFGASSINFPKRLKSKKIPKSLMPKLSEYSNDKSISS